MKEMSLVLSDAKDTVDIDRKIGQILDRRRTAVNKFTTVLLRVYEF